MSLCQSPSLTPSLSLSLSTRVREGCLRLDTPPVVLVVLLCCVVLCCVVLCCVVLSHRLLLVCVVGVVFLCCLISQMNDDLISTLFHLELKERRESTINNRQSTINNRQSTINNRQSTAVVIMMSERKKEKEEGVLSSGCKAVTEIGVPFVALLEILELQSPDLLVEKKEFHLCASFLLLGDEDLFHLDHVQVIEIEEGLTVVLSLCLSDVFADQEQIAKHEAIDLDGGLFGVDRSQRGHSPVSTLFQQEISLAHKLSAGDNQSCFLFHTTS